jgi:hypothetical protein
VAGAGDVNNDGFDDFLIGAPLADGTSQTDEGRSYLYLGSNSGVQATSYVIEGDQASAKLGMSVAGAGDLNGDGYDDVVVGASEFTMGKSKEGRAIVYLGSEAGLGAQIGVWTSDSQQTPIPAYGYSVASAGDVNNDGFDDIIVGAYQYDHGNTNEGSAFVFHGSHTGLSLSANWTAEGDQANAYFGNSVASAGDVNNDGFDDVIVGARLFDNGQADEGKAFVYRGSATGLSPSYSWTAEPNQATANFGVSVASAGDVNNDGFDDVIVGANLYNNGENDEGIVFLYRGSVNGPSLFANWSSESNKASSDYGFSVAGAGDVNGDGFDDVIIGAPKFNDTLSGEGKAFVYLGSSAGLDSGAIWTAKGGLSSVNFGYSVAGAGHTNNDTFDDVIVGAWKYSNGQTSEGRAYVFQGTADGPEAAASWYTESDQAGAWLGEVVASAGDVNGDGYDDVAVGSSLYDNGETDEGSVFVHLGDAAGLGTSAAWVLDNNQQSSNLGLSVAGAGDVNGDGYDDIVAGAQKYDITGKTDQGRAYVFLGSACVGNDGIDDDGDGFKCPFDCDDTDIDVYPGAGDATCDGIDDDCNGVQDEDYTPHTTSCGFGVCEAAGITSCALGVEDDSCVEGAPTAADDTTCDGVDQDCSGDEDEDYVSELRHCGFGVCASTGMSSCTLGVDDDNCTPGAPSAADDADCNTIDEDCSGEADEDYPETPTTCGVGACASTGAIDCVNGTVGDTCVVGTPAPSDSTCDGVDDDCDTFSDEDYVSELRHCGFGVCDSTGMSSCALGVESDNCTPGAPSAANDANCNDVDEDCSGEADEDYVETPTTCGTQGACAANGAISCIAGNVENTCTPGIPAANDTSCNGIDDDCDGNTDEDALCSDAGTDAGVFDAGTNPVADASADASDAQAGNPGQGGNAGQGGGSGGREEPGSGDGDGDGDEDPNSGNSPPDADSGLGGLPDDSDDDPSDDGRSLFADATAPEEAPCMCTLPGAQTTGDAGAMAATVLVALGLLRRRRLREPQTPTGHL